MPTIQEQVAEYKASPREAKVPATYTLPLSHRLWIEMNWEPLGYKNRSQLVQDMVAAYIDARTARTE